MRPQPVAYAPRVVHWLLRNGALHIVADKGVRHFHSLIVVILYVIVPSGIALFLFDQPAFTVVEVVSFSSISILTTNLRTIEQKRLATTEKLKAWPPLVYRILQAFSTNLLTTGLMYC